MLHVTIRAIFPSSIGAMPLSRMALECQEPRFRGPSAAWLLVILLGAASIPNDSLPFSSGRCSKSLIAEDRDTLRFSGDGTVQS